MIKKINNFILKNEKNIVEKVVCPLILFIFLFVFFGLRYLK